MVPFRLVAQASAPAAKSGPAGQVPAAQGNDAARPEAAKPEEDETVKFRHTALVQAAARVLHLSVETTARMFEFINFAIIALAIGIPLFRFLPRVIRKRSQTLLHNIDRPAR